MTTLKGRFINGVAATVSELIRLSDAEFLDLANNGFAFDGSEVPTSAISSPDRRVDFVLNYIGSLGPGGLNWRRLRLHFKGIDKIDFGYDDVELGFPHTLKRQVDLEYAVQSRYGYGPAGIRTLPLRSVSINRN